MCSSDLLTAKYRHIAPAAVRRVALREWERTKSPKEALKQTKTALHQITGAYLAQRPKYSQILQTLTEARASGSEAQWREACLQQLALHASTAERLPFLEEFYSAIFAHVTPPKRIIDLGCGLNPLTLPFMHLPLEAEYFAYDMDSEMMGFLNDYLRLAGVRGEGKVCDILTQADLELLSVQPSDLVLLFKVLPLLDQWDKSAVPALLRALPAKQIVITYPTRSLGGKGKGMEQHYTTRFEGIVEGESWNITTLYFPNEIAFIIAK